MYDEKGFRIVAPISIIYTQISKFIFIFALLNELMYEAGNKFNHIIIVRILYAGTIGSDLDQNR